MATHSAEIIIDEPSERVFAVLTKPELVALWQFGRELTTTWEVGSDIRFTSEWGDRSRVVEQWGTVLDVRVNELVRYNLFTPRPDAEDTVENRCVTSYVLAGEPGQTKVTLVQQDDRPNAFAPASLRGILVSLKEVAEAN